MQRFQGMPNVAAGLAGAALLLASAPLAAQARASAPTSSASASASASASVSPVALAERYAEEAFQAYERKDHAGAVALYRKALAAAPSADITYNLARVYDLGLHDRALAIRYYSRYLDDPGAVKNRIETARQRLAELRREPSAPAPVPSVARAEAATVVSAPPIDDAGSGSALPTLAIVSGALGLAAVGVGVGFGVAAKSRLDESQRYCDDNACTSQRGVEAARSATRAADVATLGLSTGGTLLALGTVFWLLADSETRADAAPSETRWAPRVSSREVSFTLSGSFAGL